MLIDLTNGDVRATREVTPIGTRLDIYGSRVDPGWFHRDDWHAHLNRIPARPLPTSDLSVVAGSSSPVGAVRGLFTGAGSPPVPHRSPALVKL